MLRFLQTIFGRDTDPVCIPEEFLRNAIERVVDGTDPGLRAVGGYRRRLRPVVLAAVNHVVALVDALAPPFELSPASRDGEPRARAFFYTEDKLRQAVAANPALGAFVKTLPPTADQAFGLLRMERVERLVAGGGRGEAGPGGGGLDRTLVAFSGHQFVALAESEAETRRLVRQRGFDQLIGQALSRLEMALSLRDELEKRATLLRSKLDLLRRGQWGFNVFGTVEMVDVPALESDLDDIETLLAGVGPSTEALEHNLEIVAQGLSRPAEGLHLATSTLALDRDGVRRDTPDADAPAFPLQEVTYGGGGTMTVALVHLPLDWLRSG